MQEITEYQDVIDTRGVLTWLEDLESEDPDEQDADLIKELRDLIKEADGCSGDSPEHGIMLIRDSYFESHIKETFFDCWDKEVTDRMGEWPWRHLDWEAAACEAQEDYTAVEFRGVTYWVR